MVADLRTDLRGQLATAQTIGGNIGAFFGGMAGDKIRQEKEYEKLYLEAANERFLQTLSMAGAEGWDNKTTHNAVMQIRDWARTKAGERYAFNLQRQGRTQTQSGPMGQIKFWQDAYNKALTGGDEEMKVLAKNQIQLAMQQINPEYQPEDPGEKRTAWDTVAGLFGKGKDKEKSKVQPEADAPQLPEEQTGSPMKPVNPADTEIAELVGPPEPQYDADYYQRTTTPDEQTKHKVSYATSEPDKAAESYRQAVKNMGGTDADIEDLKKVFREGNEQKIAEAIRRLSK